LVLTSPSTHALGLRHQAQWRKIAGAGRIIFEQEVVDVGLGEEPFRDRCVAAGCEGVALEVAAAHVDANRHAGKAGGPRAAALSIHIPKLRSSSGARRGGCPHSNRERTFS
jgi:hypothetical protein